MKNNIAIKVNNVSKSFHIPTERKETFKSYFLNPFHHAEKKKFDALKDVSFEIKKGEFVGIIGRNGSGKSTLLKMIAGIYLPDKGKIKVNGKIVPFLELGVGFNPELSGRENIFLNGAILGMSRKFLKEKFDEIVDFAEMREFLDVPLKNYSSGMQVRLAFSIAVHVEADIFLLDEILAVGDASFQLKSKQYLMKEIKDRDKTIIYVSHDIDSIKKFCDRLFFLKSSKAYEYSDVEEGVKDYLTTLGMNKSFDLGQKDTRGLEFIDNVNILDKEFKRVHSFHNDQEDIIVSVRYKSIINLNKYIYGISIMDESKKIIFSTNTLWNSNNVEIRSEKGHTVEFYLKNVFGNGTYEVRPAIAKKKGMEMIEEASNKFYFNIIKPIHSGAPMYYEHKTVVKK